MAVRTPLAAALDDIDARARLTRAQRQRRVRQAVDQAMDQALTLVEEANLRGDGRVAPGTRTVVLTSLAVAAGPVPDAVARATTPSLLHAALLDWHERLLNTLMPHRHEWPPRFAEELDWALDLEELAPWPDQLEGAEL